MTTQSYHPLFPLVLGFVGCHSACETPWYADLDGDGFGDRSEVVTACERPEAHVADPTDCDDTESAVHPGAPDLCNGVDDDCDGEIDADAARWFADADRDGIGTIDASVTACEAPDGYVAAAGDCDDSDPDVYPGAPVELCDGVDQDCDTQIDEGALGDRMWYPDEDRDGYGWAPEGQRLCAPPSSWVDNDLDCDDLDSQRNPDIPEECNFVDDDCDGDVDMDDDDAPVVDSVTVWQDIDLDGVGGGQPIQACGVDWGFSALGDDCDDFDGDVHPGATEACNGWDDDCDGLVDDADGSLDPSTRVPVWADLDGDGLGDPLSPSEACAVGEGEAANALDCDDLDPTVTSDHWLLDLDGDGLGAGTLRAGVNCAPPAPGYVNVGLGSDCDDTDELVFPGAVDRCGDGVDQDCTSIDPACGAPPAGVDPLERLGRAYAGGESATDGFGVVAGGADLTGDGLPDAVVAAPDWGDGDGAAYLLAGPPPEFPSLWAPSLALADVEAGGFGTALAVVEDVSGDGVADLAVSAPTGPTGIRVGVYSLAGGNPQVEVTFTGASSVGAALASGENLDGGDPELVIGSPVWDVVAVAALSPGIHLVDDSRLLLLGLISTGFGTAVACCGGGESLVVGAPGLGGAVWVIDPLESGVSNADTVDLASYFGTTGDGLGAAVATNGDLDGDGAPDVAGTAPHDAANGVDAGAAYVWTTHGSGDASALAALEVRGDLAGALLGQSVALGDVDHDGLDDLVVGASEVDVGGTDSGAVYVFYGPASGVANAITADAILYGPAAGGAGAALVLAEVDPDPGADLWVSVPGAATGTVWLLPGAP